MDKRVFAAVALCAGIFLVWENVYYKPYLDKQQAWNETARQQQQQAQGSTAGKTTEGSVTPSISAGEPSSSAAGKAKNAGVRTIKLGEESYGYEISTHGGIVTNVSMPEFRGQNTEKVGRLIGGHEQLQLSASSPDLTYLSGVNYTVDKQDKNSLVLSYDDANVSIKRTYALDPAIYSLDNDTAITFKKPASGFLAVTIGSIKSLPKSEMENERRQIFLNHVGGQKTFTVADIDELKTDQAATRWVGFSSRYFLSAIANRNDELQPEFEARPADTDQVSAGLVYKPTGSSIMIPVRMYFGPKEIEILKRAGSHLDSAVDFGWFTIFAYPMLTALKWFYKYLHNFGLAIIVLTVLVKAATYPLTLKSMKSMKQMQRIQPQLQRLRERYKDDKEKLNQEMLQLMRANGYNPMSGCLPMFIQMPIFIALYNVLYGAIDLYGQPFFGWIHDLSAKDPLYVTPALLAIMMFVQQKLTPNTAADPAQQRMMMMMPLVFGFMMLWLPSGLTLYMLVNSVTSVAQQFIINRSINAGAAAPA